MAPEVWGERYQMSSDIFSLALIFIMITEVPNPPLPQGKWEDKNDCIGLLMYKYTGAAQVKDPTTLITPPLQYSSDREVTLFNKMLQHDYHKRPQMGVVINEVNKMPEETTEAPSRWWCTIS
jgi:serine/threonine protein kinase